MNNKIEYINHVKACQLIKKNKQTSVQCAICKKDYSSAKYFLQTHLNFHAGKLYGYGSVNVVLL